MRRSPRVSSASRRKSKRLRVSLFYEIADSFAVYAVVCMLDNAVDLAVPRGYTDESGFVIALCFSLQIWFQNRRAKTKREDKLMNPESSKQTVCASPPDHDSTSCEGETPEGNDCEEDKDSNKNRSPPAQHVRQPSLPPSFPEFDPGYPDVGSELVIDQPPTPLHATSLPVFPSAPTNTCIPTSLIPCFPTPISQPSLPKTTLNYSYTPLWSHDTVINAKELEELLVTLLSSHMPKTLHATDGQRLESFKGFVNSQCNLLHQKDAEYQAMLCAI